MGTYTVTVTDFNGCLANASGDITEPAAPLNGTTAVTNILCGGTSTGAVDLTVTGGTSPYTFLWSNGATSEDLANVPAAAYTVVITDANGCTANASGTITESASAVTGSTVVTNIACNGGSTGAIDLTVSGGTAPYSVLWSNGSTNEDLSGLFAGSYSVRVTDAAGCLTDISADITEPTKLEVDETHTDATCPGVYDGSITLVISGGTPFAVGNPYNVIWDGDFLTTVTRTARDSTYTASVTDSNGCSEVISVTVGFSQGSGCLEIPKVISPNGDGKNDVWIIKNIVLYPNAELIIYNRWGKKIFATTNVAGIPWDGRFNGKLVATDSYYYILDLHDGSSKRSGYVTVLR